MAKYYVVKEGITPGIYTDWATCESMVKGYPGAKYKSFPTLEGAKEYLGYECNEKHTATCDYAFVDGSYNATTGVYGYGGFVVKGDNRYEVKGNGNDAEMASMRNVAGEIEGAMAAVRLAMTLGIKKLVIYYDYKGIEMWATGEWKRNKKGTIAYYEFMQSVKKEITLEFVKVKGHSGVLGNEEADRLAKEAVGLL